MSTAYVWETQKKADKFVRINCKEYDGVKDFKRDPTGYYVLLRPNFERYRIEVAVCDKDHQIVAAFSGRKPQDVYDAIFQHEKDNGVEFFKEKTHIAYLGKELKKVELALATGNSAYFQE